MMRDGEIVYIPDFIPALDSNIYFNRLMAAVKWQQDQITVFGKTYSVPRLQSLYGDDGVSYIYSGMTLPAHPWNEELTEIKERVEAATGVDFNAVLCNLYRDGKDSNGWHADDEPELGLHPVIASVSFGVTRRFLLRHNNDPDARMEYALNSGSLLVMKGAMQQHWKHQIPKELKVKAARINLTFRKIYGKFL